MCHKKTVQDDHIICIQIKLLYANLYLKLEETQQQSNCIIPNYISNVAETIEKLLKTKIPYIADNN